jgi:hypothetical protein
VRHFFSLLLCSLIILQASGQQTSDPLPSKQAALLFTDSLKQALNLNYPVFRVYQYADKSGQFYCVLTESNDSAGKQKDTFNHSIKAVNLKIENGMLKKTWELNDFIIKNSNEEKAIWFWTKYIDFKDYDGDSSADPIIIYGTSAMNGYSDGRIKILIYHNGQKTVIRHQNGVLDFERQTQIDSSFYTLPPVLQTAVKQKIALIIKNEQGIFPYDWQNDMKNKKALIRQRNN